MSAERLKPYLKGCVFALLLVPAGGGVTFAEETPASNFFAPDRARVEIRVPAERVVVFDELENSRYILNGRDLRIVADKILVRGNAIVRSFASPAAAAGTAVSAARAVRVAKVA